MTAQNSEVLALRKRLLAATNHTKPIWVGAVALAVFGGVFGVGAATAPINGAAIAAGSFVARGQNQVVQHLEGGIVAEILVDEGSVVSRGDILVRLDTTRARAELERLTTELHMGMAREAQLMAERDEQDRISYPGVLLEAARSDQAVARLISDQESEFSARQASRAVKIAILRQSINAGEEQIEGFLAQRDAYAIQIDLLRQEIKAVQSLYDRGLSAMDRLYGLSRTAAEIQGLDAKVKSEIGAVRQMNLEAEQQIASLERERVEAAATDVISLRLELAKLQKELKQTSDLLTRSIVVSPVDGIVVKREVNTVGGVIEEGGTIVELIPTPANLVVEARINPADIDRIFEGQAASVRIPALHIPYSPLMTARVEYVSADKLIGSEDESDYYVARISEIVLPSDIDPGRLYPGMQVEVFIITGSRTFAEYLFDPLWTSFSRSIREH
ncbi:HlyD family type I secretion periplasmic adaptor subunit [Aestuariivirga sp.]|uniref:HlyD family type I secretion periplasmic adaptor subunit n=1 Tax=Aestuariivirga sp. TaxID=2650926 RepID=UPI0035937440